MGFKKDDSGSLPKSSSDLCLAFYYVSTFWGTVQRWSFLLLFLGAIGIIKVIFEESIMQLYGQTYRLKKIIFLNKK